MTSAALLPQLARLLARGRDAGTLVAAVHETALRLTPAVASVLVRPDPRSGQWLAVSAGGLERVSLSPWLISPDAIHLVGHALAGDQPLVVDSLDRDVPELAALLGTSAGVLVPIIGAEQPLGLLLLGLPSVESFDASAAAMLADAMAIALDRQRADDALTQHRDVAELMQAFEQRSATPLMLVPALEGICRGVARVMAADVVEMWHHDRRARELVCLAAADPRGRVQAARVSTADPTALLAAILRRDRAELVTADAGVLGTSVGVAVPLRGRRRALGVLAAYGVRLEPGGEGPLLERAGQIGRQLAAILENVQLLDAVVQSRAELENVFNSLADLVAVMDSAGRLVDVNEVFATRVGCPRAALADRPVADVVSAGLATWIADAAQDIRESRGRQQVAMDDDRLGGRFNLTLTPLIGLEGGPTGLVLVARDITAESRLEAERARLERRLGQSEKLLALGQFVAGVAHELNNPLQGVLGHIELMRASAATPEPLRRDLALVHREADRAARIVRSLLVFAGSGRLQRRRLNLNGIAARVLRLRAPAHKAAGLAVERDFADALPTVKGDRLLLQQALLNLVLNAEQAMASGGRLSVETCSTGAAVTVAVRDTGPGLSAAVRDRLFEPFFTTKDVGHGTGLGLAITYGIVQAHGGSIEAGNHESGGARFAITLKV